MEKIEGFLNAIKEKNSAWNGWWNEQLELQTSWNFVGSHVTNANFKRIETNKK